MFLLLLQFYAEKLVLWRKCSIKIPIVDPICHEWGGHIASSADSFVCCGSIRDFEKVKFSENS